LWISAIQREQLMVQERGVIGCKSKVLRRGEAWDPEQRWGLASVRSVVCRGVQRMAGLVTGRLGLGIPT
jgi:hypothetical protein